MKKIDIPVGDPTVGGQVSAAPKAIGRFARLKIWWKRRAAEADAPLSEEERLELQAW